jgi:hypothetical protein
MDTAVQVIFERRKVQSDGLGVTVEILGFEVFLMLKEQIMHFPEPALMGGGLRRFGRLLGVPMLVHEREMPEHES